MTCLLIIIYIVQSNAKMYRTRCLKRKASVFKRVVTYFITSIKISTLQASNDVSNCRYNRNDEASIQNKIGKNYLLEPIGQLTAAG